MKKLFICALVAGSLLMVSCGGSPKKAAEPEKSKSKAEIFAEKLFEVEAKDDYQGMELVNAEIEKYINSLSEEEKVKFLAEFEKALNPGDDAVANEGANAAQTTVEPAQVDLPRVYSNCYDGYLNVRAQPTSKSQILGRLDNGPEGAELLGVEGSWSKVRVNGVVGYAASKYLQSTETDPVYVDASAFVGEWVWIGGSSGAAYTILDNGKFTFENTSGTQKSGTWHLSYNDIVLKYSNSSKVGTIENDRLVIDGYEYMKN